MELEAGDVRLAEDHCVARIQWSFGDARGLRIVYKRAVARVLVLDHDAPVLNADPQVTLRDARIADDDLRRTTITPDVLAVHSDLKLLPRKRPGNKLDRAVVLRKHIAVSRDRHRARKIDRCALIPAHRHRHWRRGWRRWWRRRPVRSRRNSHCR